VSLGWTRPILAALPESFLPMDYLVARVKGRSVYIIHDWQAYQQGMVQGDDLLRQRFPEAEHGLAELPWRMFYHELTWLYGHMNPTLRTRFGPLLSYWVFQLMVSAMRRLMQGQAAGLHVQTANLVAAPLYRILRHCDNIPTVLDQLQQQGFVSVERSSQFSSMLKTEGYAAVETTLWNALFQFVASATSGLPGRLLASLIDIRNLCALHKRDRWQVQQSPQWFPHGRVGKIALRRTLDNFQWKRINRLLLSTGWQLPEPPADPGLEQQLLRQLTGQVRFWARENQDEAVLVRYLWERYIETINLSVMQRLYPNYPQRVNAELIV